MTQRTILFRGKSENYGWIEGFYLKNHEGECFIQNIDIHGYAKIEVDPATVGQFTGEIDKNENRIFEGDIDSMGWIVCFESGVFCVKETINAKTFIPFSDVYETKIIGNIHDNPELI